jgi:hypothetical protein
MSPARPEVIGSGAFAFVRILCDRSPVPRLGQGQWWMEVGVWILLRDSRIYFLKRTVLVHAEKKVRRLRRLLLRQEFGWMQLGIVGRNVVEYNLRRP